MGSLDGAAVAVGNLELMEDVLSNLPDDLEEQVAKRARRGTTVVLVAKVNGCSAGWNSAIASRNV